MWRIRFLPLFIVTTWTGAGKAVPQVLPLQRVEITPITVVSMSERRWASSVGLRIIVRDVDQPDSLISDARAIVEPMSARGAAPLTATSDTAGVAGIVAPDSGEYHVRVLRLGYDRLEFRVRLEADCHHVLEAYLSRAAGPISAPMYTAKEPKTVGKEPKRTRTPARTLGRAVLTTCPPSA